VRIQTLVASSAIVALLGACRNEPSAPAAGKNASANAADGAMPTKPYDQFLTDYPDEERRKLLWKDFRAAEHEAKTFAASPERWVVIQRVVVGTSGAKWHAGGFIELAPMSEPGTLFHETFHTVFHKSVFHAGKDRGWGEPWCDAFRYIAEREILLPPPSGWVTKLQRYMTMTFDEVMAKSGDPKHDEHYAYPASLILKETDGTVAGLRRLWFELADKSEKQGGAVLDAFFRYSMEERRPL